MYIYTFIEWGNFITNLGFNAGDGLRHVMFPEAFTAAVQSIEETSNVDVTGVYAFRVDGFFIEARNGNILYTYYTNTISLPLASCPVSDRLSPHESASGCNLMNPS